MTVKPGTRDHKYLESLLKLEDDARQMAHSLNGLEAEALAEFAPGHSALYAATAALVRTAAEILKTAASTLEGDDEL